MASARGTERLRSVHTVQRRQAGGSPLSLLPSRMGRRREHVRVRCGFAVAYLALLIADPNGALGNRTRLPPSIHPHVLGLGNRQTLPTH